MRSVHISSFSSVKLKVTKKCRKGNYGNNNKKAWKTRKTFATAWRKVCAELYMNGYTSTYIGGLFRVSSASVHRWAVKYYKHKPKKYQRRTEVELEIVKMVRIKVA